MTARSTRVASKKSTTGEIGWVETLIEALEQDRTVEAPPPAHELDDVAQRFGLVLVERALLVLLGEVEWSFSLRRRLQALGPMNVGLVRALLETAGIVDVVQCLSPTRALRTHALVHVEGAQGRLVAASDPVRLEVGLVPRVVGPGLTWFEPAKVRTENALARRLAFLAPEGRGRAAGSGLASPVAQIVLTEQACTPQLAQALADGLGRIVVAGSARRLDAASLSILRRDCDLVGAALWLSEVELEGVLAPPPLNPIAPPLVIVPEASLVEPCAPWQLRRDKVAAEAPAPLSDLDHVRTLAQRDADRAMGIVRPLAPTRPVVPGRIVDASVRIAEAPAPEAVPAVEANPVAVAPAEEQQLAPIPVAPPVAPVAVVPVEAEPAIASDENEGPRLELPVNAPIDLRARAAFQSPSARQRIELLEGLSGLRHPAVIAALRHNVKSEHPPLRTVAERLMARLFGADWHRNRAIAPPVQPPVSEE